jgi:hypothetical protein
MQALVPDSQMCGPPVGPEVTLEPPEPALESYRRFAGTPELAQHEVEEGVGALSLRTASMRSPISASEGSARRRLISARIYSQRNSGNCSFCRSSHKPL